MNLKPKRKAKLSEFTIKEYGINGRHLSKVFSALCIIVYDIDIFA